MATILLADDSVTIQRVIELTFANEGIRVVTVTDGDAAIAQVRAERPDIILADVGLPQVDGYRLAEQVKRTPELAGVPVLLLTGAFEPVDEARARESGCDGVLVKPFEPQRLVGTVKSLLAGRRPDHLWPTDMPRLEGSGRAPEAPRPARGGLGNHVGEPEPVPAPSAGEQVFESGLDDLDKAFSRLDPVAPPSGLDADTASDFQRDLQELRSAAPAAEPPPPRPSVSVGRAVSHLPIEEATPVEAADLQWDLPVPTTIVDAIPLPASFPTEPEPTPVPAPVPAPVTVPALAAPVAEPATPAPPPPPTPPAPPPPPAPPAPPASLSSAFAALLAAEQAQPGMAPGREVPAVPEAEVEEVVRRVVTRMTEEVVQKMVQESAERLIREEMAKFKR